MTPCPICQKPVDSLRARAVSVRGGKVVAYCSQECLAKDSGAPVPAAAPAATPEVKAPVVAAKKPAVPAAKDGKVRATREDYDSGPVIEILHEPSSGVVTSAPDKRDSKPVVAAAEPSKPVAAAAAPAKSTEIDPREVLGPDEDDEDDDEAPAKAETKLEDSPGQRTLRRRRDSIDAKMADDWLDDEPADVRPGTLTDEDQPAERRGSSKFLVTLFVLAVLGGGGYLVYYYVVAPRAAGSPRPQNELPVPPAPSGTIDPPAKIDPAPAADTGSGKPAEQPTPVDRATAALRTHLGNTDSPRIQRLAAMALSRTGDAAAIERLVTALDKDKLEDAGRLDVAYALARAGNQRGIETLVSGLRSGRRDTSLGAARLLAQLGDRRAIDRLAGFLEVPQIRLGAAEQLATFAEPRAIAMLEQILKAASANADEKAAATIALVVAGKTDHVDAVRKLLVDPRFNVFAADALAGHHDEAARPVLEKLLELTQLRAGAARSLRRLGAERDLSAHASKLVAALDDPKQHKDLDQIVTAEAILLLVGPVSWSERR